MRSKEWLVVGVILTAVVIVGGVIAITRPAPPRTLPMALPIPAGTVIRVTNITNVNGTVVNGSIAVFTVLAPGGRLVGEYHINGGYLLPWLSPSPPDIFCPLYGSPAGTKSLNYTLDPGAYALWIYCTPAILNQPTPANPILINVTQTIEMVYG